MKNNYLKSAKKYCSVFAFLVSLLIAPTVSASTLESEPTIAVPVSTLKQLLAESNLQAQILEKLEKNNSAQLMELAALKAELKTSKIKLQKAESLSANAEKALTEANALFEAYSKEQKARLQKAQSQTRLAKRQRDFYGVLGGVAITGCLAAIAANHK